MQTGTDEIYVYGNYFDGYHWDGYNTTAPSQADREAFLFHIDTEPVYTTLDSAGVLWFGRWLALISGLGVAISGANIRSWIKNRRESSDD